MSQLRIKTKNGKGRRQAATILKILSRSMDGVDVMKFENGKIKEVFLFSADQTAEDAFWI